MKGRNRFFLWAFLLPFGTTLSHPPAVAAQDEDLRFQALDIRGKVMVYRDETDETVRLHKGQKVDDGDRLTTESGSEAVLRLKGRVYLHLAPHTQVRITRLRVGDRGLQVRLNLLKGRLLCQADQTPTWALEVSCAKLVCRGHGTLFEVSRQKNDVQMVCFQGNVVGSSPKGHAEMAKARQVVRFSSGRFQYRRYLRIREEGDLQEWKDHLRALQHPLHPSSRATAGR